MRLKIAARHSDLARLQAFRVGDAIRNAHPQCEIEYAFRASLGDLNQTDPLWKMPEKGVFTEDFLRDLHDGAADLVVHSWKDLPTHPRPGTEIVATLPRADSRDVLLARRGRGGTGQVFRVLTSSPRRAHNLRAFLMAHLPFQPSAIEFVDVRGNIPTRVRKLFEQDCDALIVAKAALDRLLQAPEPDFAVTRSFLRESLSRVNFMVLPLAVNPTAAAQGALAIEIASTRSDLKELLRAINCPATFAAVSEERSVLASYGGGCHQKIGVSILTRAFGEVKYLRGLTDRSENLDQISLTRKEALSPRALSADAIFPRADESAMFFDRRALAPAQWAEASRAPHLWVARETAWPEGFTPWAETTVWTAGLRTWRGLAARGVWVHGSAEGLGEQESPRLEMLLGASAPVEWLKLSHAASTEGAMPLCATYELIPAAQTPDLRGRTHFFWMSGSAFLRALELFPEIRTAFHACGPGLTARKIRETLPNAKLDLFLSIEDWRRAVSP